MRKIKSGFYISDQELRKEILKEERNYVDYLILQLYDMLCVYGESVLRPLLFTILTIIFFPLLRMFLLGLGWTAYDWNIFFINELKRSLLCFFFLEQRDWIDLLEKIVSAPLLASLTVSLKKKLEIFF